MTNYTKHTPGPWKQCLHIICQDIGVFKSGKVIVDLSKTKKINVTDEDRANAQLIAAAPELLQSLKELRAYVINYKKCDNHGLLKDVERAINKAEGE